MSQEMDGCVARLRGLPWSATPNDIMKFFDGCEILDGEKGVHLTFSREGRASGEAFVEFASEEDIEKGLEKNNDHMGSRYIEVFRSKKSEMEWVIKRAGPDQVQNMSEAVVRLRGLPFGCSKEEIAQFFTGFEIVPNGIMLPEDRMGRSTGEAFVQFASQEIAEKALGKHKDRIGHRYIEIFKSSLSDANAVVGSQRGFRPMGMGRPGPYDRNDRYGGPMGGMGGPMGMGYNRGRGGRNVKGYIDDDFDDYNGGGFGMGFGMSRGGRGGMRGGRMGAMMDDRRGGYPGSHYISKTGHSVHMRGLPFQANEQDVFDFFAPIQPVRVNFEFGPSGRPAGEANVDFATHQEAMDAMKKHRANMQHRYIELFLNSTPSTRGGSDGGGYGGDLGGAFPGNSMGGGSGGNFGNGGGGGYNDGGNSNMGGGFGMGSGGSGGGFGNQGTGFNSPSAQQFNSNNSNMGGGYGGMGGGSMGGNMGGGMGGGMGSNTGGGYGGQGMNNSYMDGGYNNMGNMANPNYTAF